MHTSACPEWTKSDHKSSSTDVGLAAAAKRKNGTRIIYNLRQFNRWKFIPPPLPPKIKDGKIARFGFCVASSLIWEDRGLLFHSILSKISLSRSPFCLVTQRFSPLLGKERCVTRQKQLRGMLCIIRHVIFPQMCRKWVDTFLETINKKVYSSGRLFKPCLANAWQNRVLKHFHFAQEAPQNVSLNTVYLNSLMKAYKA